jgi:plastocyanin
VHNRRAVLVAFTLAAVAACGGSYDATYPGGGTGAGGGVTGGGTGAGSGGGVAGGGAVGAVTIGAGIQFVSQHNGSSNAAIDTIAAGTAMTWTWTGALPHSVRSVGATSFASSDTRTGSGTYSVTFATPGTYKYDCAVHGSAMTGTIVVTGATTGTADPAPAGTTDTTSTGTPGTTPGGTPVGTPGYARSGA